MKTKEMLQKATAVNALATIIHAERNGWSIESILRHGSEAVAAAVATRAVPKARKVAQVQQVQYNARETRAKLTPVKGEAGLELTVNALLNGKTRVAKLNIGAPRKKAAPDNGVTHDCGLSFVDGKGIHSHNFTLSVMAVTRLRGGERVQVWLQTKKGEGRRSHVLTLAD